MTQLYIATVIMLVLMLGGVWVAAALGLAGAYGLAQMLSFEGMISIIGKMAWQQGTSFVFLALPLFVFMGEVLMQAGTMNRIYNAASKLVAALPGGLLQTNIAASMVFAACTGSSLASAATISSVGYPTLVKRGYDKALALGSISAGGTLGILIPPSVIFIIYGVLAEVSVGKLFLAGVLPGILLGFVYSLYIGIRVWLDPSLAPREPRSSLREIGAALLDLWQIVVLVIVVLGGIYGGIASPTEIGALGTTCAFIFAAIDRKLTFECVRTACINTVKTTSMILLIITMAKVMSMTLTYSQASNQLVEWVAQIGATPTDIIIALMVIYLIMGCFFDGASMMVITIPFVIPILSAAHIDLVWLGVLICINIEVGLLTPPLGLNLYVMQGVTSEPFGTIVRGSLPFAALQVLVMILIFLFPAIAMVVPNKMF